MKKEKLVLNQEQKQVIAMYGLKVASKKYGIAERALRHQAEKLAIELPSNETVATNVANLI
ncbi:hypothetical protein KGV31_002141 [Vibrio parahaemolyticus]|nr:hypothetical protein [Vibrio parahaemolyticus]EHU0344285.1 hypothetical protein [Vibrio parahaemolyticus]EHU0354319.1 hypothetical protein [Vibrio parahaemolyticus]